MASSAGLADIRYYPKAEKWVIIKENGLKQIYGGKKDKLPENNSYIQWGIKWGGRNGNWIGSTTNTSGQEPFALAWNLAAFGNYFTISIYDSASKSCKLLLYYQNEIYQQWTRKEIDNVSTAHGNFNWSLSNNFATGTFIKSYRDGNVQYGIRVYGWNADFNVSLAFSKDYSVPRDGQLPYYYSITTGSLLANLGHVWRYNGDEWKESNLRVENGTTKFAYGSDLAVLSHSQSETASSSNSSDIKAYDSYRDSWKTADIDGSWSKDEYHPTVSGDFVTIGNGIFYKNNQGQLNKDKTSIPDDIKPDSIINRAPYYIACETDDGKSQIFFLKNGKVVNSENLSEKIYVDNDVDDGSGKEKLKSGIMLARLNAFVTYDGNDFEQASSLNLYYVANESIKGTVTDFPVGKVTLNDGYKKLRLAMIMIQVK